MYIQIPLQIGYTFLPCVLAGLSKAPQYLMNFPQSLEKGCLVASDVDSVLLPMNACGGDGALAFSRSKRNKVETSKPWLSSDFFFLIKKLWLILERADPFIAWWYSHLTYLAIPVILTMSGWYLAAISMRFKHCFSFSATYNHCGGKWNSSWRYTR